MPRIIVNLATGEQTVDEDFVPPPPPVATDADRTSAKAAIAALADALAKEITGPVPETERASWPTKETAARSFLANQAAPHQTAMLQGEAALTGETLTALASKVVANADAYIAIAGTLTGFRRVWMGNVDALGASATVVDVGNVVAAARSAADVLRSGLV